MKLNYSNQEEVKAFILEILVENQMLRMEAASAQETASYWMREYTKAKKETREEKRVDSMWIDESEEEP